jgi:trypsin
VFGHKICEIDFLFSLTRFATTTFAGSNVDAAGWGTLEFGGPQSKKLMKVTLNVLTNTDCQTRLGSATVINSAQICTFSTGKDTCQVSVFETNILT